MKVAEKKIMSWIDALPGVNDTQFPARRDQIAEMMAEAAKLVRRADELRGNAYFAACRLEADARSHWPNAEVDRVKNSHW